MTAVALKPYGAAAATVKLAALASKMICLERHCSKHPFLGDWLNKRVKWICCEPKRRAMELTFRFALNGASASFGTTGFGTAAPQTGAPCPVRSFI
jgi:hypothetical protein